MTVQKRMNKDTNGSVVLRSRSQSEIIATRRKARRARINAVHSEVNHILNQNNDLTSSITVRNNTGKQNRYDLYNSAIKEVAVATEE
ncbi:hypothetical protein FS935_21180 [Metabacillus litoralis]|uniref:Uncharacterized protein n=1 Tax=Metabacillus litoralis TaxID=152268 RepID=A0A5C6VBV1_9BACI|nr:hypothetical protein [Metabacillus litoralis]TXC82211.1 hypothetical protein FS935_21180 [Metabacillus litoralis]